ncbi:MAG TPA: MaoC family dehydratase [Leptospiraceae bacterium]|nr:MaoC family dehydratase [Leptospirales bacterium]HMU82383.1 MaoC family dehydratase [Leptospiraceae bacterium]HMX55342.1 MaoC family dehydratase [Leptospiraceae bacterium]HMZ36924.1 MaoC family dehydratase [Leptospiraceae bacterium]HNJ34349.1 MaoC family dehydratase [Leptospiraceae bacterium]
MAKFPLNSFPELAPSHPADISKSIQKEYGRTLDDFVDGDVFLHPRAFTIDRTFAQEFATVFHESSPLFLSAPYAQAHGFADMLVHPLQVFNVILSLGVQNNSEKAIANLGYYNVQFLKPVYPGDTLTGRTRVLSKKVRGEGKPGIVHVNTLGLNQRGEVVIQYERKIMIPPGDGKSAPKRGDANLPFPVVKDPSCELPDAKSLSTDMKHHTLSNTYFEDFEAGQILVHKNMRTITDEHVPWTYRMGNTHPLHYDRLYSAGLSGPMSGEPIVYGGLVFGWLCGLASRDLTENMLWDLGYTEGYHTAPAISGDTVGSISRIVAKEEGPMPNTGILHVQLIGVKNVKTKEAFDKHGADLFIKENDKKDMGKEKIPEKIFEIERRILLKKKGYGA